MELFQRIQDRTLLFRKQEELFFLDADPFRQFFAVFENGGKDSENFFGQDSRSGQFFRQRSIIQYAHGKFFDVRQSGFGQDDPLRFRRPDHLNAAGGKTDCMGELQRDIPVQPILEEFHDGIFVFFACPTGFMVRSS